VGGRGAESPDRVAGGDFSSRANRVESDRRGQALVEMTVVGRASLSLGFSDLATLSLEAGERRAAPLERKRTACWRSWKSKTGLGLGLGFGLGLGRGWSSRYCAHGGQRRISSTDAARPGISPSLPSPRFRQPLRGQAKTSLSRGERGITLNHCFQWLAKSSLEAGGRVGKRGTSEAPLMCAYRRKRGDAALAENTRTHWIPIS
jgi:hypothetical protein